MTNLKGRRAVTYEAVLPDGSTARKRSLIVDQPVAWMGCFQAAGQGQWLVAGVYAEPRPEIDNQTFIQARRLA